MARILIIDAAAPLRGVLVEALELAGHDVLQAEDGRQGIEVFRAEPFEVIVTDIVMPNREGLETIITLHREFPEVGVIAMSGAVSNSKVYLDMAARLGAHRTLAKPFTPRQLHDAIAAVLGARPSTGVRRKCAAPESEESG